MKFEMRYHIIFKLFEKPTDAPGEVIDEADDLGDALDIKSQSAIAYGRSGAITCVDTDTGKLI